MASIYGGDEVNALVFDLGTSCFKAGYAGDDAPKAVFPSVVGLAAKGHDAGSNGMEVDSGAGEAAAKTAGRQHFVGNTALSYARDHMEVASPFGADALLEDWDLAEALYSHAFKERLCVDPAEFAAMVAEPSHNTREAREKTVQLLFERFNVPALFLSRAAVLSSFATARQTSVVVDAGYRATTVSAVQDGYLLTKSVSRSPVGGQLLTACMAQVVQAKARGAPIRPRYSFKRVEVRPGEFSVEEVARPHVSSSYRAWQVEAIAADVKEAVCRVSEGAFNEQENTTIPNVSYELPDGQEIHIGTDRFKVPEVLFQTETLKTFPGAASDPLLASVIADDGAALPTALPGLVMECINKCDVDVRKELCQGIVLTGGCSLFPQVRERLERELVDAVPQGAKVKVLAPANNTERRFSVWIGGSILSSLGSFQQMWMSKKEYEEHGAGLIHRKAP